MRNMKNIKRPQLTEILCLLGFIVAVLGIYRFFTGTTNMWGELIFNVLFLASLLFIWYMKKIGVIALALLLVIYYIVYVVPAALNVWSYIIPAIFYIVIIALFFWNFKKMD